MSNRQHLNTDNRLLTNLDVRGQCQIISWSMWRPQTDNYLLQSSKGEAFPLGPRSDHFFMPADAAGLWMFLAVFRVTRESVDVNMSTCQHVNMSTCQHVKISTYQHVNMSICQYVNMSTVALTLWMFLAVCRVTRESVDVNMSTCVSVGELS